MWVTGWRKRGETVRVGSFSNTHGRPGRLRMQAENSVIQLNSNGPFFNRTSEIMQLDPRGMLPQPGGNRLLVGLFLRRKHSGGTNYDTASRTGGTSSGVFLRTTIPGTADLSETLPKCRGIARARLARPHRSASGISVPPPAVRLTVPLTDGDPNGYRVQPRPTQVAPHRRENFLFVWRNSGVGHPRTWQTSTKSKNR
jgi:hypothetical protein